MSALLWAAVVAVVIFDAVMLVHVVFTWIRDRRARLDPDREPTQQEINRAAYRWEG